MKNLPREVEFPFTPMVLRKMNRRIPAAAAWRARFSVPSVFTLRNSLSGLSAVSRMTCTRAARWTTASAPWSAVDQFVAALMSPTKNEFKDALDSLWARIGAEISCRFI